jgi:glycosyltransferase involved in cell wall biosynthesis
MRRKRRASLFFDQAGTHTLATFGIDEVIGWYANSAVEAMAFGIPTIAHLSDSSMRKAASAGFPADQGPILNIKRTSQALAQAILEFAQAGPEERYASSQASRTFAETFHGYRSVAMRLSNTYQRIARHS